MPVDWRLSGESEAAEQTATLLGPEIGPFMIELVEKTGASPSQWARAALVSQLRRDQGMRRYSLRRRGLAPLGKVDALSWDATEP